MYERSRRHSCRWKAKEEDRKEKKHGIKPEILSEMTSWCVNSIKD
jgi:hypothetical protein